MGRIPIPVAGLVVRYDFLWPDEFSRGQVHGKDRPACVALVVEASAVPGLYEVLLLPITHRQPGPGVLAIELPADEKRRLGLDDQRSWIALESANRELWPNGLVPTGPRGAYAYGKVSDPFGRRLVALFREAARARRLRIVPRA